MRIAQRAWIPALLVAAGVNAQPPSHLTDVTVSILAPDGKTPLRAVRVVLAPVDVEPTAKSPKRHEQLVWRPTEASFERVPAGLYRVHLFVGGQWGGPLAPTHKPAFSQDVEVTKANSRFTLVATGVHCLIGRITEADGKTPIVGKEVRLTTVRPDPREGFGGGAGFRAGETDEPGRFALPVRPPEPCELKVTLAESRKRNFTRSAWWTHPLGRLTPEAEGNTEVEYNLPAFPGVTGTILDVDGKPLGDTEVGLLFSAQGEGYTRTMPAHVTTSGDGAYRVHESRLPLMARLRG